MRELGELERALADIEARSAAASAAFLESGSDLAAMQLAEAASDVVAAGRRMLVAQQKATRSTLDVAMQLQSVSSEAEWVIAVETPELGELRIVWKAWFFFVRALCDHIYRLLLASAEGKPARRTGSMNAALNPRNPVAIVLAEGAPEFIPWFARFRRQRNEVKDGVNFGFTALASAGIAVTFNVFQFNRETGRRSVLIDSSGDRRMTLADVLDATGRVADALAIVGAPARNGQA